METPTNHHENAERLPARVYFVESHDDPTVLVALRVTITGEKIQWFDTTHERHLTVDEVLDANPDHFVFRRAADEGGKTYTLVPLTLDIYQRSLKGRFRGPKQDFQDEEELLSTLEKSREDAW